MLLAYFQPAPDLAAFLEKGLATLTTSCLEAIPVPDVDWVERFREGFRAFSCGRFWIAPEWETAMPPAGLRRLTVDPGRAFGTGTHETTRLCLAALEEEAAARKPGDRLLDVGTGSGILAIAAALLGWRHVVGVELDPDALESARVHARLNDARPAFVRGDGGAPFRPRSFQLILANITAPLLRARSAELGSLLAPGGTLVLSGLLGEDGQDVAAAYESLGRVDTRSDGEWLALRIRARP